MRGMMLALLALLALTPLGPAQAAAVFTGGTGYGYSVTANDSSYRAVSFQVKTTQTAGTVGLVGHHNSSGSAQGYTVIMQADGTLQLQAKVGSSQAFLLVGTHSVNDGAWHSVALNLTFGLGLNAIYVDGVLDASVPGSGGTLWGGTTQPLRIGRTVDTFWTAFDGNICDVRVYSALLTTDQVTSLGKKFNPGRINRSLTYETAFIRDGFEPHGLTASAVGSPTFTDHCPRVG